MKRLIPLLFLFSLPALAQRGGAVQPFRNLMSQCTNVVEGYNCSGKELTFCMDYVATTTIICGCSASSHVWVCVEQDSGGTPTTVAFANSLSANGGNCNPGSAAGGTSATGASEDCTAYQPLDAELTSLANATIGTNGKIWKSNGTVASWQDDATGAGPFTFDLLASGTNTTAAMVCGAGCTLGTTSTGTITANGLACGSACVDLLTEVGTFASADMLNRCTDESGTGVVVFNNGPSLTNPLVGTQAALNNSTRAASTAYSDAAITAERTATRTATGMSYDADGGSGNVLTISTKAWLPAAGCQASTASSFWDNLTANPATPTCLTGSNTQKGTLDFDPTTNEFAQQSILLPSDWTGTIDAKFVYISAGSGNVIWGIQTACVADSESTDPSFNTASTVTDASLASSTSRNSAAITGVTATGCAAGELMWINVYRDAASASDTMTGNDARLLGVELTMRRAM